MRLSRARARHSARSDEAVAATVRRLRAAGRADNTYIVFMSDNGLRAR